MPTTSFPGGRTWRNSPLLYARKPGYGRAADQGDRRNDGAFPRRRCRGQLCPQLSADRQSSARNASCHSRSDQRCGEGAVETEIAPWTAAEDFSYMLESRPGAFILMGNGDTAGLHNEEYDFDDAALPYGISYWVRLAEARLAECAL
nr:M20/M25/M40 family metallo-hydrolase [Marinicella sp. W31]MDC2875699.1 M20/M25/M40 family metallo-hydrolase [Marinicella sp. W31]